MSISLDSYDYGFAAGNMVHGVIQDPDYDLKIDIQTFWGVVGAAVNYSEEETRVLTLDTTFYGFSTQALLATHVNTVRTHVADSGTLTVDSIDWPLCSFVGFKPSGVRFYDATGANGWVQEGELHFIQIAS